MRTQTKKLTISGKNYKKNGGFITNMEKWGIKKLAYPIEKNKIRFEEGYYITYFFVSDPKNITELQKELEKHDDVIKFIICDTTDKWND